MSDTILDPTLSKTHTVFRHAFPQGSNYCLKSGETIFFHGGMYATDNEEIISELSKEAKRLGSFITEDEEKVDPRELDPIEMIKLKAIQDYIAASLKAQNKQSGSSEYVPVSSVPAASSDLGMTKLQEAAKEAAKLQEVVVAKTGGTK